MSGLPYRCCGLRDNCLCVFDESRALMSIGSGVMHLNSCAFLEKEIENDKESAINWIRKYKQHYDCEATGEDIYHSMFPELGEW